MVSDLKNLLLAAFEVGRLLSQFRWNLMQNAMLRDDEHGQKWQDDLAAIAGKVIQFSPTAVTGRHVHDQIAECSREWYSAYRSLKHSEDHKKAGRYLYRKCGEQSLGEFRQSVISEAFDYIIDESSWRHLTIREMVVKGWGNIPVVHEAILLGEVVDEGLHPPDVERHLYEPAVNPEWIRFLAEHPDGSYRDLGAPTQIMLTYHWRLSGELQPRHSWTHTISALWHRLGLNPDLLDPLIHSHGQEQPDSPWNAASLRDVNEHLVNVARDGLRLYDDQSFALRQGVNVQSRRGDELDTAATPLPEARPAGAPPASDDSTNTPAEATPAGAPPASDDSTNTLEQIGPVSRAIALMLQFDRDGRRITVAAIANIVGCSPSTLYRDKHFSALRDAMKDKKRTNTLRGFRNQSGQIESGFDPDEE